MTVSEPPAEANLLRTLPYVLRWTWLGARVGLAIATAAGSPRQGRAGQPAVCWSSSTD
jgi:hypothetical protein